MERKDHSFSVLLIAICLMIAGVALVTQLNFQLSPSESSTKIQVSYSWQNTSARVIESKVTSVLEGVFSRINGLTSIKSNTKRGSGYIEILLDKGTDIDAVRFELASYIRQTYDDLPEGVTFPQISLNASGHKSKPLLNYTVNSTLSTHLISQFIEANIQSKLTRIKGVGSVTIYGATPYQWEIMFDSEKMSALFISPDDIANQVNAYFQTTQLGLVDVNTAGDQINVVLSGANARKNSFDAIVLKKIKDRTIYLSDVAEIKYKEAAPSSYYRINGLNTVNFVVYPENGVNHLVGANKVKEEVRLISSLMPPNISVKLAYDESEYLSKELKVNGFRSLFSLIILLLFVIISTRSIRYFLLIVISLFANLSLAVVFYYFLRLEIHLYSIAGLTISFGLIIDNAVVMIDHLKNKGDKRIITAILAATLTTVGALSLILFLKEDQRQLLVDFGWVVGVNLFVSVLIALYLIPSLLQRPYFQLLQKGSSFRKIKTFAKSVRVYERWVIKIRKFKWFFIIAGIYSFGIPFFALPDKIESETLLAEYYNQSLGSEGFIKKIKPWLKDYLGGSLSLFANDVFEKSYYTTPERTVLHIGGKMPKGCTLQQMNDVIKIMESYLSSFVEIESYHTSITSAEQADISIYFDEQYENGSFPYILKRKIESKAIGLGGLDWSVYGVGRGFSNALNTGYRNSRIYLEGYNYDQLYKYAEYLKAILLENPRIKEVDISSPNDWFTTNDQEYTISLNAYQMALRKISQDSIYDLLQLKTYNGFLNSVFINNQTQKVSLRSDTHTQFDWWQLNHLALGNSSGWVRFGDLGSATLSNSGNEVYKENQQYIISDAYDFIGPFMMQKKVMEAHVNKINALMPIGFRAYTKSWDGWDKKEKSQYILLLYVVFIIYVVCAVLFESFRKPNAVILMIPFSFIGIFLTFYLFDINFDQGGYASFVMVAGLVVNAAIYIINDFNCQQKKNGNKRPSYNYSLALLSKLRPIMLTILSSVLGLIPFLFGGQKEVFWYAFASGTIGGLLFSIIAIVVFLPLFVKMSTINQPE